MKFIQTLQHIWKMQTRRKIDSPCPVSVDTSLFYVYSNIIGTILQKQFCMWFIPFHGILHYLKIFLILVIIRKTTEEAIFKKVMATKLEITAKNLHFYLVYIKILLVWVLS